MDRINGKAITLKSGGKFYSGVTDVDWTSAVKAETSLIKEDDGVEQEEIVGFDEKFSISGIICVGSPNVAQKETITLQGDAGTANVTAAGGLTKLATYATGLTETAAAFVTSHAAAYLAVGIVVTSALAVITFTANVAGVPFVAPLIANATSNLTGTVVSTVANITDDSATHIDWSAIRAAYRAKAKIAFVYGMFVNGKPEVSGNLQLMSLSEKTGSSGKATYSADAKIVQDSSLVYGVTPTV